jgi:hypothetical protein
MKTAWTILTVVFLGAVMYLGRQQRSFAEEGDARQGAQAAASPDAQHRLSESMQRKLDHINQNAQNNPPDQTPTVMTEEEVNDYLAYGTVKLPLGVRKVTLRGQSGVINALVNVDFDEIRGGQRSPNPLLAIFSGRHDVRLDADAAGSGGQGKVHVRNVSIDGVDVPAVALEYFVQKYVTPKYPNVGIDSQFQLPARIDLATVGYHKLTVTQK